MHIHSALSLQTFFKNELNELYLAVTESFWSAFIIGMHKLWMRSCICEMTDHDHTGSCSVEFETTYAPDRPELVYCESCYQEKIL